MSSLSKLLTEHEAEEFQDPLTRSPDPTLSGVHEARKETQGRV